jgi:hypothetical protein
LAVVGCVQFGTLLAGVLEWNLADNKKKQLMPAAGQPSMFPTTFPTVFRAKSNFLVWHPPDLRPVFPPIENSFVASFAQT